MVRKQLLSDATDALVAGRFGEAAGHIAEAERVAPAISVDRQFAYLKLDVLGRLAGREAEAEAHYLSAAKQFRGDAAMQTQLAMSALRGMPGNLAVARAAHDGLAEVIQAESWASKPTDMQLAATVLLADAGTRLGLRADADAAIEHAALLVGTLALSERSRRWGRSEIERLRAEARF